MNFRLLTIFLLIILLSCSLGKTIYEGFRAINEYNNLGCNGDTFDGCVKNHGMSWCAQNCRNTLPTSLCKVNSNSGNWSECLHINGVDWCQTNCRDANNNPYIPGYKDIL